MDHMYTDYLAAYASARSGGMFHHRLVRAAAQHPAAPSPDQSHSTEAFALGVHDGMTGEPPDTKASVLQRVAKLEVSTSAIMQTTELLGLPMNTSTATVFDKLYEAWRYSSERAYALSNELQQLTKGERAE